MSDNRKCFGEVKTKDNRTSLAFRASQFKKDFMYCKCAISMPVRSEESKRKSVWFCYKCKLLINPENDNINE